MANVTIPNLTSDTTIAPSTDLMVLEQTEGTRKATLSQIFTSSATSGSGLGITSGGVYTIKSGLDSDISDINTLLGNTSIASIGDGTVTGAVSKINEITHGTCTNLLNPTAQTQTINGVTLTNNGDGTYTLTGTETGAGTNFVFKTNIELEDKQYKWIAENNTDIVSSDVVKIAKNGGTRTVLGADKGNGFVFTADSSMYKYEFRLFVLPSATVPDITFKPMLTTDLSATYDDFVQYSGDGELNANVAEMYKTIETLKNAITELGGTI
jgi:hypothetical protein